MTAIKSKSGINDVIATLIGLLATITTLTTEDTNFQF